MTDEKIASVGADGRSVTRVPKEKWLCTRWPELEIDCLVCGYRIRFNEFVERGKRGTRRSVPKVHAGSCTELYKAGRLLERAAKDKIRRRDDVKNVSRKRLDKELGNLIRHKGRGKNRFDASLSKLMGKHPYPCV